MSDVALRMAAPLSDQLQYAKALASADLLPVAYRDKPANLLLALAYGDSLNLSISQVLNGINVIEGKPSMGAELMSALTRQQGHRIRVAGDDESASCSIWRSDDPDFEYRAVWTIERAVQAGLCTVKDGRPWARSKYGKPLPWEAYPAAMLRARAISECCRMAVADVLAGVSYTPEELEPVQWVDAAPEPPPPAAAVPPMPRRQTRKEIPAEAGSTDPAEPVPESSKSAATAEPPTRTGEPDVSAQLDQVELDEWRADWLDRLDGAMQTNDLDMVQVLGTEAATRGADDLVEDARNTWTIVSGR